MTPETDLPLDGEILPPNFMRGLAEFHAHQAFDDLARVYGLQQARKLWDEIAKEHGDDDSAS